MSRENVDAVYRAYDAIRRRDLHDFLDLMHPEVEATSRIMEAEGTVYRGREGMRQFIEDIWSVFPDWRPEVASARGVGDAVVAEIRATGRAVRSGVSLDIAAWQAVRFRSGQAVWISGYTTEEEALEAVGVRE